MKHLRRIENAVTRFYRFSRVLPAGNAPPPLFYYFLLTYRCNLACSFCVQRLQSPVGADAFLEESKIDSLLRQVPRISLVSFSGGEPFCHPSAMPILERATRTHRVSLVTNGTLLDDASIARLIDMGADWFGASGLTVLGISMQERSGRGSYRDRMNEKIKTLKQVRRRRESRGKRLPVIDVKVVIREESLPDLAGYLNLLEDGLADTVTFQLQNNLVYHAYYDGQLERVASPGDPLRAVLRDEPARVHSSDLLRRQLEALFSSSWRRRGRVRFYPEVGFEETFHYCLGRGLQKRYTCAFPWSGVMISPLGRAFQCRNPNPADLNSRSLSEAWNGSSFRDFRRLVAKADVGVKCAGCCFLVR